MQWTAALSRLFYHAFLWKVNLSELVWQHLPICESQEASEVNVHVNSFPSVMLHPVGFGVLFLLFNLLCNLICFSVAGCECDTAKNEKDKRQHNGVTRMLLRTTVEVLEFPHLRAQPLWFFFFFHFETHLRYNY